MTADSFQRLVNNQQPIASGIAQTRYQEITLTLAAGQTETIFEIFNYFRILANTGVNLQVQFGDDSFNSKFTGSGLGLRFENTPNRLVITNTSGVAGTITIALAMGWIYDDRLNVSGILNVQGSVSNTTNSVLKSIADVALAAGVLTAIVAANASRRGVIITNIGSGTARIGDNTNTGAARGAQLLPNQSITLETLDAISGFSTAGSSVSILEY